MRIVFFGNHLYGHHCLAALIQADFAPTLVIANYPRKGEIPWYPSVAELAVANGIETLRLNKISEDNALAEKLERMGPDLFVVSSFRNLLDGRMLDIPKLGCINLHMAPLPRYRGAHPENWAIVNGEKEMGFTVHYLDEGIDTGDIILQSSVPILSSDTIISLTYKLADAGPELVLDALRHIQTGNAPRIQQEESQSSYFPPRKPSDGEIDWNQSPEEVLNLVRALVRPYPGAFAIFEGKRYRIWAGETAEDSGLPGEILSRDGSYFIVACGERSIRILEYDIQ